MEKTEEQIPLSVRADPVVLALGFVLVLTLWRVVMLAFNATDLFFDEAQYWLWGRSIEFGYFSKPPLIAWVIRASTEIGGSNSEFWVRLPGPLFHAVAAIVIMAIARSLWTARTAALIGATYITLPAVSFGSQIISTDTILIPFFALAFLAFLRLTRDRSAVWAVVLGLAVGTGAMAKYAMVYFVLCALIVTMLYPKYRIGWRDAAIAAIVALAAVAPNIFWNIDNDLNTVRHTAENAGWAGIAYNWSGLGEFFAAQFAVFGPILFAAYIWICILALTRRLEDRSAMLVCMSLPILTVIIIQAFVSKAYANWAAMTYVGATLVTVPCLIDNRPRLLTWSLALHMAIAIALPVSAAIPDRVSFFGIKAFDRVMGRSAFSDKVMAVAGTAGLNVILADRRSELADLFYGTHGTGLSVFAAPRDYRREHHYTSRYLYSPETSEPVLLVTRDREWLACLNSGDAEELERWTPPGGAYGGREFIALRVMPGCWAMAP